MLFKFKFTAAYCDILNEYSSYIAKRIITVISCHNYCENLVFVNSGGNRERRRRSGFLHHVTMHSHMADKKVSNT